MISHALLRQCFQWCPLKPPLSKKLGIAEIYLHAFPSYQAMTPDNNTVPLTDLDNRTGQRQNFPFARHFNIFFFFPELQEKIYIRKIPKQQILNRFHFRNTGLFPNQNESSSPPNSWKPSSCWLKTQKLLLPSPHLPDPLQHLTAGSRAADMPELLPGAGCSLSLAPALGQGKPKRCIGQKCWGAVPWCGGMEGQAPGSGPQKPAQGPE